MDTTQGFTELRMSLAEARSRLRAAKDSHELAKAEAEQKAISAGLANGKNAEERSRALTLILAHDDDYLPALGNLRHCEHEVDRLEALLESARDARRVDEWRIRAQLVEALNRGGVASDSPDRTGDGTFDDAADYAADKSLAYGDYKRPAAAGRGITGVYTNETDNSLYPDDWYKQG